MLTETKGEPPKIENFTWFSKQREKEKGGGIAIAIKNELAKFSTIAKELEEGDDEIMWVKIEHQNREVDYIGCVYGLQERNRIEEVERQFNNITTQIEIAQNRGQVILAGDFNAKIKVDKRDYKQATSRNGRLLENMLETTKCTAANLKSTTGLWTRQNRSNTNEKSIIDYIITCDQMEKRIENIEVDEKGTLRMKNDRTETDHNSIIVQVTIPRTSKESQREKVWKLRNED